ncbi:dihydroorotase [Polaribacter porphyrae]|uniref:Dihydroorotase n=1 Tax=Polaribacter porphyrae TaxID=1137780 RepID=A0A2S7WT57_9FLAO|nr:dihydroorotase [Polaribacter porphyrae]PQJ80789.1 dihydroorotase [Polaribacter porphyrae]
MKNYIITILSVFFLSISNFSQTSNSNFKVGDKFLVGKTEMNNYEHIKFPRKNFIIKKGGIATYKNIIGREVTITSLKEHKNGTLLAIIKLTSNKKFFNSHKFIKVNIRKAISEKELLRI